MPDEFIIDYSTICNEWMVLRIPGWALERAGDKGYWQTDDGDEYVPAEMATIERVCASKREAEEYLVAIN